ncbi:polysaccharide deacetylase family protein [Acidiferrimicrobium sp. IK]|uniref:polysaccharide deacetylase family protein n=1 Tax=Acidiferrimicrobium sp. IK TaxID=2871700 RepID=UPI0021CB2881|nr:polysaccharide deacetylase family protein [Acidiferrimicrobium sp. IK]MCU4184378.1 polysaccharide deacetylase family protein [Acidiferrimicrobium sp. IK]
MTRRGAGPLAALGGSAVLFHVAPAAVAWRRMRCRVVPALSGVGRPGHVALTFDDGPDPRSTPVILEALAKLDWKATFFVLGSQVRRAPDLLDEILDQGHELGVHGDHHVSHLRRPAPWAVADVRRARDLVEDRTGQAMRWFRPPYGALAASSVVAGRRNGLQTVLWSTWGRDWREEATPGSVVADVTRTWHAGPTVLLHDSDVTSAAGSWRSAVGALPLLAEAWEHYDVGPLRDHGLPLRGRAALA